MLRMSTAFIGGAVVVEVVVVVVVVVLVVVVVVVLVVVVVVVEVVVEVVVVEAVVVGVVVGDVVIGAVEVISGFIVVVSEWLLDKPAASPIIKHIRTPANALNRISFDDHVRLCFNLPKRTIRIFCRNHSIIRSTKCLKFDHVFDSIVEAYTMNILLNHLQKL